MTASRCRLLTGPLLSKRRGRLIPEPRMPSLTVIEELDVLRNLVSSLFTSLEMPVMHQFVLQRPPKTFHRRIVVAVASPTHGGIRPNCFSVA